MSGKLFEIDRLEERIAPSSVDVGSIADGVLSGLDASNALSNNHVLSGNDPSINGNSFNVGNGNNATLGPVLSDIHL